ncbi:MAG TPA: ATP-dependent DNA ligase [Candidatus Baltobacteraceae bacterium]|jgi:ATP-dependent DNA ligase|nr:ATP-dependent DNA ligase [Candidatus Baltobacteraceae bacterium]
MFENLPVRPPLEPMEARATTSIPRGDGWLYEPKWDGFRCIAFRDGDDLALQSKSGQPLERYFPEVVSALAELRAKRFVLDGEIFIEQDGELDFDDLLQRIHPAASRIRKLSVETPATYALFDILVDATGAELFKEPLELRRDALERFAQNEIDGARRIGLSPASRSYSDAENWLNGTISQFDGAMAKRLDRPYRFGERDSVSKIKRVYTADCVVGGFRLAKDNKTIGSLLLGLYDDEGLLNLVGFIGSLNGAERARAGELLKPIVQEPGFTGTRPGGVSRWGSRDTEWFPVAPKVVVEVHFDHVTGRRFRHGARFMRWRPDKAPRRCTMEQLTDRVNVGHETLRTQDDQILKPPARRRKR